MADVVHWHSRRIAACVAGEETESAGEIERFWTKPYIIYIFFVSLYAADETSHRSGQF